MTTYTEYRDAAIEIAHKAGEIITHDFKQNVAWISKPDTSWVTETDTRINALVLEYLSSRFPNIPIISEEGNYKDRKKDSGPVWVCDPLDGTAVFSHGIPACAFSLALVENGESILGVVFDPFLERMFVGVKGEQTLINGKPTHTSLENNLENTMVGMSLWAGSTYDFSPLILQFKKAHILPLNLFSTVYMGMLVASGNLSATLYLDRHAYDVAALKVIVEGAGGRVTDLFGKQQRYDQPVRGCLMSNSILHDSYLQLITESVKQKIPAI